MGEWKQIVVAIPTVCSIVNGFLFLFVDDERAKSRLFRMSVLTGIWGIASLLALIAESLGG